MVQERVGIMRKVLVPVILGLLLLLYLAVLFVSRIGETKVVVKVLPETATVTINKEVVKPGIQYLKPGEYSFEARLDGWTADSQIVGVGNKTMNISLLPAPNSMKADSYLRQNPKIQLEREKLGGERYTEGAKKNLEQNPIVGILPHSEISGPFSIDYGYTQDTHRLFIIVSDSTPNGRVNALKWMRSQGYNPVDFDIRYYDYSSPLSGEGY